MDDLESEFEYTPLPGERWLHNNWAELESEQNGVRNFEWVAADGEGLIAHHPSLPELIARVEARDREEGAVYAYFHYPAQLGRNR